MEKLLNNIIKVLISDTTDMTVIENLVIIMFNKNVIEKTLKINEPIFDEKTIKFIIITKNKNGSWYRNNKHFKNKR